MNFSKTKVIVFDLDGTLYEDTHHFDYYAERLKDKLSSDVQSIFEKEYTLAKEDQHALTLGRVYDVDRDLILVQLNSLVQEAYTWEGEALSEEKVRDFYPDPIVMDYVHFINVGDLWWVPVSIAIHYGLSSEKAQTAFLETREFMMGPDYSMQQIPGLKELCAALNPKIKLVLLTNSPEPDSEVLLQKLELNKLFDLKLFNGKKPVKTLDLFAKVKETFDVEYEEILSVGDNWLNEILPVQSLGCSTIYIDNHHLGTPDSADIVVGSMKDVIPYLKRLV